LKLTAVLIADSTAGSTVVVHLLSWFLAELVFHAVVDIIHRCCCRCVNYHNIFEMGAV